MDGCGRRRAVALRGSVRWLASHGSSAAAATYNQQQQQQRRWMVLIPDCSEDGENM